MHQTHSRHHLALTLAAGLILAGSPATVQPSARAAQDPAASAAPGGTVRPGNGRPAPAPSGSRFGSRTRDYLLAPGDKLRIEVYKDPQLSQSVQVRPDGKITMPLIGDVEAAGLAPLALRDALASGLKEYVTNPVVTVIVVEAQPATAYVVGEVQNPGAIQVATSMTVLQALALAGGLKDFADSKNIRVLRNSITGVQTIRFNYRDALQGLGAPVYVNPGDTVVVPN
ncbi:MAG: polysaccharide biosynthesis/export family protein [Vicinamibacterales bacterium]